MPPLEGFDGSTNLQGGSSLYENIVGEVNTYSNELKHQFQISFTKIQNEDIAATRDIIVGKHPLYEPSSPEDEEFIVGNDARSESSSSSLLMQEKQQQQQQQQQQPEQQPEQQLFENNDGRPSRQSGVQKETYQKKRRQNGSPIGCTDNSGCNTRDVALEWLDLFTGICLATSNRGSPNGSKNTHDAVDAPCQQPPTWSDPVRMTNCQDEKEDEGSQSFVPLEDPMIQKARILYPIAKYPSRLNSPRLVQQRRKFLEDQVSFKPLRLDARKPRKAKNVPVCVKGF